MSSWLFCQALQAGGDLKSLEWATATVTWSESTKSGTGVLVLDILWRDDVEEGICDGWGDGSFNCVEDESTEDVSNEEAQLQYIAK